MGTKNVRDYPWKRRRRRLVLGLLGGIGATMLLLGGNGWRVHRRIETQYAAIRAAGEPVTREEMARWWPLPPPERDATRIYGPAFGIKPTQELSRLRERISTALWTTASCGPVSDSLADSMRAYRDACAEKLRRLQEAAAHTGVRLSLHWDKDSEAQAPYLPEFREASFLLQVNAVLAAQDGDGNEAGESLLAMLRIAGIFAADPFTYSQGMRMSILSTFHSALSHVLQSTALPEEQLAPLVAACRYHDSTEPLVRALMCMRSESDWLFTHPEINNIKMRVVEDIVRGGTGSVYKLLRLTGFSAYDQARFLAEITQQLDPCRIAFEAWLSPATTPEQIVLGPRYVSGVPRISDELRREVTLFEVSYGNTLARLRCDYVALAVERFRLAHRRLPLSPVELVPDFLDRLPLDPFDGQPMHYVVRETGYTVYSVAQNRRDDGGEQNSTYGRGDLVFEVGR
jgi:hypothetical protein